MLCHIYRSNKKTNTYLYLSKKDDLECLPESLLQVFGTPEFTMSINLTADRKLAQVDSKDVLDKLEIDGYFLQLPKHDFNLQQIEDGIVRSLQSENSHEQ